MKGAWPDGLRKQKLFFRFLLGSWFLATLVLVNAYSSLLISYLTIPTLVPVAKSLDDVAYYRVKNGQGILEKVGLGANLLFVSIIIFLLPFHVCCTNEFLTLHRMCLMMTIWKVNYLSDHKYLLNTFVVILKDSLTHFNKDSIWCLQGNFLMQRYEDYLVGSYFKLLH